MPHIILENVKKLVSMSEYKLYIRDNFLLLILQHGIFSFKFTFDLITSNLILFTLKGKRIKFAISNDDSCLQKISCTKNIPEIWKFIRIIVRVYEFVIRISKKNLLFHRCMCTDDHDFNQAYQIFRQVQVDGVIFRLRVYQLRISKCIEILYLLVC